MVYSAIGVAWMPLEVVSAIDVDLNGPEST
jgi:hypothetical protein